MNMKHHRGYTLLEMIVSVGIFSVVMLAATGAYLTLIRLDKEARATNDLANNLTFAVDSMVRSIRTGTGYKCNNDSVTPNCDSPGSSFGFLDSEPTPRTVVYSRSGTQLMATINGTQFPLTDPRVQVDSLAFYVRGVGTSNQLQPSVTFTIKGSMQVSDGVNRTFVIQSGATQRFLDL